jgi:REP element-mobilizing transposase RayT
MPRANRYFLPGYVWHITHRCHQRQFLLKFGRDRCRYLHWLFKAKKRFGLCVLDYMQPASDLVGPGQPIDLAIEDCINSAV